MSQQSGIFDSTRVVSTVEGFPRGDKAVDATFLAHSKRLYYKNGVFPNPSTNFQVLAYQNMTVQIRPGSCFVNGFEAWDDETEYITIPVSTSARAVFIVQRLTLSPAENAEIKKDYVVGTSGTTPTRTGEVYEIFLARIDIPGSATSITDAMITDLRLDGDVCGIVSGSVDSVDTTSLSKQYQAWFESVQYSLSGDAAGALQNQIFGITDLQYNNVVVSSGLWQPNSGYASYPYFANIPLSAVTADMIADVFFAMEEASAGIYAPVAISYAGGVRIYATAAQPAITIPVIRLRKAVS